MASNEDILREADYYLNNEGTQKDVSKTLGISIRTMQLHMQKLKEIDPDKYKMVIEKKEAQQKQGRVVGGSLGKRGPKWTIDDAIGVAKVMIEEELTYQEAGKRLGIPKSTIYEMLHKADLSTEVSSNLYVLSEANKLGMTVSEYKNFHNRIHKITTSIHDDIMEERINNIGKK